MAIFSRALDVLKANINDLLDKAEDPEKMLKQIIIDMEEQLQKAMQGLGQVMANERQMRKQLEEAQAQSKLWEDRAKVALNAGNQELARQAVENKLKADQNVKQFQELHAQLEAQVNEIREQVKTLQSKLEEARSKQSVLIARAKVADARQSVSKALGNIDSSGVMAKMEKMERKISAKEAQADVTAEMAGVESKEDPFVKLEKESAVENELARLMKEMSKE